MMVFFFHPFFMSLCVCVCVFPRGVKEKVQIPFKAFGNVLRAEKNRNDPLGHLKKEKVTLYIYEKEIRKLFYVKGRGSEICYPCT